MCVCGGAIVISQAPLLVVREQPFSALENLPHEERLEREEELGQIYTSLAARHIVAFARGGMFRRRQEHLRELALSKAVCSEAAGEHLGDVKGRMIRVEFEP